MLIIQVTALSNVEAKKRFEFLEAVSETMASHLRYFKQVELKWLTDWLDFLNIVFLSFPIH